MIVVDVNGVYFFPCRFVNRRSKVKIDTTGDPEHQLFDVNGLMDGSCRWEVQQSEFAFIASNDKKWFRVLNMHGGCPVYLDFIVGIAETLHVFVGKFLEISLRILVVGLSDVLHDLRELLVIDGDIIYLELLKHIWFWFGNEIYLVAVHTLKIRKDSHVV